MYQASVKKPVLTGMKRVVVTALSFLFLLCHVSYSQISIRKLTSVPQLSDSAYTVYQKGKNKLLAGSLIFGMNMAVWAADRYILKGEYAYISPQTMKNNFKHGFVWDNDRMETNMFLHPYHGSLYYNAARSNGYDYWRSGVFSLGGSLMWEMFMENEYPSVNDLVVTPIGGMILGEMFYRTTDLILNDRTTGKERAGREIAAFILSPARGLMRIMTGDAWRWRPFSGKQFGIPPVFVEVSVGIRGLELRDDILDSGIGISTEINVEYGDRFEAENNLPFDYFSVKACLNGQASQPVLGQFSVISRIAGTEIQNNDKRYLSLGLYHHFDYYNSDTISDISAKTPYRFSAPASFGLGAVYQYRKLKRWDVDAYGHLNAIILGCSLSDYYKVEDRNYNLASGFSTKMGFNFVYKKGLFAASTSYEVYRMYTWKGYPDHIDWNNPVHETLSTQGDKSNAILHAISLRWDVRLKNNLYLTGIGRTYSRETRYKKFDTVTSVTGEGRLLLTYKF